MIRKTTLLVAGGMVGATAVIGLSQSPLFTNSVANAAAADTYRQLSLFGDVYERIRADYVEVPDEAKLVEAAIGGMLTSLDPHSSYMNAKAFGDMQVQTRGEFGGLGIEVTMDDGLVKVISPIDDSPAFKAGIRPADLIAGIDGVQVQGLTLDQAVEKMRGPVGTAVTLTVSRQGSDQPIEVKIVRDIVQVAVVKSRIENDIGYLRVSQFNEKTFEGLRTAIAKIKTDVAADKLKGYVVDLRNNPGGLLDQAVSVSDSFLEKGEIVQTRGRRNEDVQRYDAKVGDLTDGKPVIVLINGAAASASEIVAGALQDQRRATVVGTRSFGKGSVQTIIPLGQNGGLRLTTARYYTPSGRSIQAKGIQPDIEVKQDVPAELAANTQGAGEAGLKGHLANEAGGEQTASSFYIPTDPAKDTQLNFAFDLLRGVQRNAAFPPDPTRGVPN